MSKFEALALAVDEPARMTIVHPGTGASLCIQGDEKSVAYIDVYSADSDIAKTHHRRYGQKRLDALQRKRKLNTKVEEYEEADIELLVALTSGWRLIGLDGAPLDVEFSADNARELYSTQAFAWLRDQVNEFSADRGNFSKASSKS